MKQQVSPGIIAAAVVGILVVIGVLWKVFMTGGPGVAAGGDTKPPAYAEALEKGDKNNPAVRSYGQAYAQSKQGGQGSPGGSSR